MKRLLLIACLILAGCITDHQKKAAKDTDAINRNIAKSVENMKATITGAATSAFATQAAINKELRTNDSVNVRVASDMNDLTLLQLGLPGAKDAAEATRMVDALTSENIKLREEGERLKRQHFAAAEKLQAESRRIEAEKDGLIERMKKDYAIAAERANKWEKLVGFGKKILWGLGLFIAFGVTINILAFVPTTAGICLPLARIFNGFTGGILGSIGNVVFKTVPASYSHADAVPRSQYDQLKAEQLAQQETLDDLVSSIQELRRRDRDTFDAKLEPHLKEATNEVTRQEILRAKTRLKLI